jgi:methionyl-tRNA formyltransferase
MGTPEFAVPTLDAIVNSKYNLVGVVTTPDMPAGRGQKIKMSAVKESALKYSIPILQPNNLKDNDFIEECKSLNPDIIVVVAFRKLPDEVWKIAKKGTFNLHSSLLPQYRGAAPMNWAIINGEEETGLTTFFIDDKIDTGKIIRTQNYPIFENDTIEDLHDRLAPEGAKIVMQTINDIETGNVNPLSQEEIIKKYNIKELKKAPKIFREHCKIDWNQSAKDIRNLIRGLSPIPGAHSLMSFPSENNISMKIYSAEIVCDDNIKLKPGEIVFCKKRILVGTGDNLILAINDIKPECKNRMSVDAFINGCKETEYCYFR